MLGAESSEIVSKPTVAADQYVDACVYFSLSNCSTRFTGSRIVAVCYRLAELEASFKDGGVTAKGYVMRKASLLREELTAKSLEAIQDLELRFCNGDISEVRVGVLHSKWLYGYNDQLYIVVFSRTISCAMQRRRLAGELMAW